MADGPWLCGSVIVRAEPGVVAPLVIVFVIVSQRVSACAFLFGVAGGAPGFLTRSLPRGTATREPEARESDSFSCR